MLPPWGSLSSVAPPLFPQPLPQTAWAPQFCVFIPRRTQVPGNRQSPQVTTSSRCLRHPYPCTLIPPDFTYKARIWPRVMVSSCNPSTQGDEATGLWFCNQPGFHNDTLSKTKQNPQLLKMKLLAIPRWPEQGVTPNVGPFCLTPQDALLDLTT